MPAFDMPIEKLRNYMGCNPCPSDFDEFWDEGIAEIEAIDPKVEFVPTSYPLKNGTCYDVYYTSTKNARIHCRLIKPNNIDGKVPSVIKFHGLSRSFADWTELLPYVNQGYVVVGMDARGQAGPSQDVGGTVGPTFSTPYSRGLSDDKHNLYQREVFLDAALLAKIVMKLPYVDETRVGVFGGSQGGGISVACAALVPSIKKCAVWLPYLSDYKRVWELDVDEGSQQGLRYYFRTQDPRHEHENEIFEKLGYIDIQNFAKRIKAEVLMGTALRDRTCPPSTQFAVYNKLTCKKDILVYPDFGHEGLYTHDDKVFEFLSDL